MSNNTITRTHTLCLYVRRGRLVEVLRVRRSDTEFLANMRDDSEMVNYSLTIMKVLLIITVTNEGTEKGD